VYSLLSPPTPSPPPLPAVYGRLSPPTPVPLLRTPSGLPFFFLISFAGFDVRVLFKHDFLMPLRICGVSSPSFGSRIKSPWTFGLFFPITFLLVGIFLCFIFSRPRCFFFFFSTQILSFFPGSCSLSQTCLFFPVARFRSFGFFSLVGPRPFRSLLSLHLALLFLESEEFLFSFHSVNPFFFSGWSFFERRLPVVGFFSFLNRVLIEDQ